jgi:broad specificity phosphatase PhoE
MLLEPTESARLILLRHPQLADPSREQALGRLDAELSRRGQQQCVELMRTLASVQIDEILCSPAGHCRSAADALAKDRGLSPTSVEALHDQDLGLWSGRRWDAIRENDEALLRDFFADYGLVAPPEGETLTAAVDRALEWWSDKAPICQEKTLLIILSAPLLSGFAARLLGFSLRRALALNLPAAGLGILDVFRDGAAIRTWHPNCLRDDLP